jgi:hypothetical protein
MCPGRNLGDALRRLHERAMKRRESGVNCGAAAKVAANQPNLMISGIQLFYRTFI